MKIDVIQHVGAMRRRVAYSQRDGKPTHVVVATRTYDTTQDDLWDAITNPERIPRWFLPVTGEFRVGGRYQLQGNAGGEILRCDRPAHLALTWAFGGQVSWVDVRLSPDPKGGTRLELEHTAEVDEARWKQFGPGAVGVGWELGLTGLALHLANRGAAVDPKAFESWSMSEEGKLFVRRSSEGWCEASIAAGTKPEEAKEAAARTTAFYTGEAPPQAGT